MDGDNTNLEPQGDAGGSPQGDIGPQDQLPQGADAQAQGAAAAAPAKDPAIEALENQVRELTSSLEFYRGQVSVAAQRPQEPPKDPSLSVFDSMNDAEVLTVGEMKNILTHILGQERNMFSSAVQDVRFTAQTGDYQTVIQKDLPAVLKEDPTLFQLLESVPPGATRSRLGYILGKYMKPQPAPAQNPASPQDAARVQANLAKPNPAAAGRVTSANPAAMYENMTDEDFEAHFAKVMNQKSN